jgi:hypothetical protein
LAPGAGVQFGVNGAVVTSVLIGVTDVPGTTGQKPFSCSQ